MTHKTFTLGPRNPYAIVCLDCGSSYYALTLDSKGACPICSRRQFYLKHKFSQIRSLVKSTQQNPTKADLIQAFPELQRLNKTALRHLLRYLAYS
jgi:DNA-directed RNA polymerase subunit RPC12/RpoP